MTCEVSAIFIMANTMIEIMLFQQLISMREVHTVEAYYVGVSTKIGMNLFFSNRLSIPGCLTPEISSYQHIERAITSSAVRQQTHHTNFYDIQGKQVKREE
jgi:hypothetical protein